MSTYYLLLKLVQGDVLAVGQKISEHKQFTVSVSDSLWRLQGRCFSLPGSGRRSVTRQREHGEIQVGSPRIKRGAIH